MIKRVFVQPTSEEIKERRKMYKKAALLGIDLMGYDESSQSFMERRDKREAVVLLRTERYLKNRKSGWLRGKLTKEIKIKKCRKLILVNRSTINSGRIIRTYPQAVKQYLPDYMGLIFEKICQD